MSLSVVLEWRFGIMIPNTQVSVYSVKVSLLQGQ